jgi:four helix bundle protein
MSRDHRKLRVFAEAHQLTIAIYKYTRSFPRDEWFGLRAQIRRASVSIATNIVEGSARRTTREYLSFLNISRASAGEVAYMVDLSFELGLIAKDPHEELQRMCSIVVPQLEALVSRVSQLLAEEGNAQRVKRPRRQELKSWRCPKPKAESLTLSPDALPPHAQ